MDMTMTVNNVEELMAVLQTMDPAAMEAAGSAIAYTKFSEGPFNFFIGYHFSLHFFSQ